MSGTAILSIERLHFILSLSVMLIFCVSCLLALILAVQDSRLHRSPTQRLKGLPSLQSMESALFKLIALGFTVLSLLIVTSLSIFNNIFCQPLLSKTILSLGTWAVYATLLIGRYGFGWRGRFAVFWVLIGFGLLIIVYVGTFLLLP